MLLERIVASASSAASSLQVFFISVSTTNCLPEEGQVVFAFLVTLIVLVFSIAVLVMESQRRAAEVDAAATAVENERNARARQPRPRPPSPPPLPAPASAARQWYHHHRHRHHHHDVEQREIAERQVPFPEPPIRLAMDPPRVPLAMDPPVVRMGAMAAAPEAPRRGILPPPQIMARARFTGARATIRNDSYTPPASSSSTSTAPPSAPPSSSAAAANNSSRTSTKRNKPLKSPPPTSFNSSSDADRERALRLIQGDDDDDGEHGQAKSLWKHLPDEWKHDKQLILAALDNHQAPLPCKSEFERTFPQSLRFDKDIVLAFCRRPDFAYKKKKTKNKNNPSKLLLSPPPEDDCDNADSNVEDDEKSDSSSDDEDRGLYYERHLFVPGCLTNDKEVMMAYCQKIPRSLQDCSEDLCNDRDVVTAAITHCSGLELQYASVQLQQDLELVKLACANHGRSLEFCPLLSPTRQMLVQDRDFMLNVVLNNPGGGPMWKLLPPALQQDDEELLLRALANGLLLRDVPKQFIRLDFLTKAVQQNCHLYLQLKNIKVKVPTDLLSTTAAATVTHARTSRVRQDRTEAMKWNNHPVLATEAVISEQSTPEIHSAALGDDGCPDLKENRQVVVAICKRGSTEMLEDILGPTRTANDGDNNNNNNNNNNIDLANDDAALAAVLQFNMLQPNAADANNNDQAFPVAAAALLVGPPVAIIPPPPPPPPALLQHPRSRFCDDMEIMKLAVHRDPAFFAVASARLQAEPELILASITPQSAWNTLKTVPWPIQLEHPEITIKTIDLCESRNLRYLPTHIPEEIWTNHREVCMAWIRRGGRVLDVFERMVRNDTEMALLIVKHNYHEFYKIGERLLGDRGFILQALQLDGRVFRYASQTLRQDFEVMIMAVANYYTNCPNRQHPSVSQTFAGLMDLDALKVEIKRLLDLHDMYLNQFLRGITVKTPHLAPALRSQLTMLDRGVETSQAFKQLIAEYLGVPIGAKLTLLRKADENVNHPPVSGSAGASRLNLDDPLFDPPERRVERPFRFLARLRAQRDARFNRINNDHGNDDDDDDDDDDNADAHADLRRIRDRLRARAAAMAAMDIDDPPRLLHNRARDDNNRGDEIRRMIREDRQDAIAAMQVRQEARDRGMRSILADLDATHRQIEDAALQQFGQAGQDAEETRPTGNRPFFLRRLMAQRRMRQLNGENDDDDYRPQNERHANAAAAAAAVAGQNNNNAPDPPAAAMPFGLGNLWPPDRDHAAAGWTIINSNASASAVRLGDNERPQEREAQERRLAAERRRHSDEMLARLEARNSRARAAERRRQGFADPNDDDDDDGVPARARGPPRLIGGNGWDPFEFDPIHDDDVDDDDDDMFPGL